jgi:hypothetical protein
VGSIRCLVEVQPNPVRIDPSCRRTGRIHHQLGRSEDAVLSHPMAGHPYLPSSEPAIGVARLARYRPSEAVRYGSEAR